MSRRASVRPARKSYFMTFSGLGRPYGATLIGFTDVSRPISWWPFIPIERNLKGPEWGWPYSAPLGHIAPRCYLSSRIGPEWLVPATHGQVPVSAIDSGQIRDPAPGRDWRSLVIYINVSVGILQRDKLMDTSVDSGQRKINSAFI